MEQTAVEWLEKVYSDACYNNMTHNIQISKDFIPNIIAKAKEMEKQQIAYSKEDMKSFADWCRNGLLNTEYSVDKLDEHLKQWESFKKK